MKTLFILSAIIALSTGAAHAETENIKVDTFNLTITDCTPKCLHEIKQSEPFKNFLVKCSAEKNCEAVDLKMELPNCVETSCHIKVEN